MNKLRYHSDPITGAICAVVFATIWSLMLAPRKAWELILFVIAIVISPLTFAIEWAIKPTRK